MTSLDGKSHTVLCNADGYACIIDGSVVVEKNLGINYRYSDGQVYIPKGDQFLKF